MWWSEAPSNRVWRLVSRFVLACKGYAVQILFSRFLTLRDRTDHQIFTIWSESARPVGLEWSQLPFGRLSASESGPRKRLLECPFLRQQNAMLYLLPSGDGYARRIPKIR